jgi:hypothetical protein
MDKPISLLALFSLIAIALIFDLLNGLHDAANSIATVVSTRVLRSQYAVIWAAFFNFIAFLFFGLSKRCGLRSWRRLRERSVRRRRPSKGTAPLAGRTGPSFGFRGGATLVAMRMTFSSSPSHQRGRPSPFRPPGIRITLSLAMLEDDIDDARSQGRLARSRYGCDLLLVFDAGLRAAIRRSHHATTRLSPPSPCR